MLLDALEQDPARGLTPADCMRLLDLSAPQDARRRLLALEAAGQLWRAQRRGDVQRWFNTQVLAQAWQALPEVARRRDPQALGLAGVDRPLTGALGAFPMPVPVQVFAAAPVVAADGAVYTPGLALSRSELQQGKVTAHPPGEPWGCGFAAAGVGRDPQTGRAWA